MNNDAIAIVGMACCYPDACNPQALWENALAQRRAFRRLPPERLNLDDYFSPDAATPDTLYADEAALIEGYDFDRVKFRVVGSTFRAADLTHWLALDVADQALQNAGFAAGEGLPRESTGVLLGNTLTGEFSRAATLRLRWPYVRRVVEARLIEEGWQAARRQAFLQSLELSYKAPFPPVGEETLAGGLSNTIAGRICNHFQLHGGGYTVDGACSSSLLAVANACSALVAGDLDVALAGGVDLSIDPFELVGFAKTGALAHGAMRVYDRSSSGFLPGEGCGFVVLMRHEDAVARGLRCDAVIRGWGISSDGGGGITRPEIHGQTLAITRAHRRAGYGIESVALFEGHGTGTAVGDEVELRTLTQARRRAQAQSPAVISSIKANIGHTKAAAGVAGLIKAVMALHHQVLPPATGTDHPHSLLTGDDAALRTLSQGEIWPPMLPLRAGVSAFGFGGINVHLTLEGTATQRRSALTSLDLCLLFSPQDAELFLLVADSPAALAAQVQRLLELALRLSYAELGDLAAQLAAEAGAGLLRAALVAASPQELAAGLARLADVLAHGETQRIDVEARVFLGTNEHPPVIAFLFPGQAAPVRCEGGAMARRFPEVAALYATTRLPQATNPDSTAIAQPAIVTAEVAGLRLLRRLGVEARVAVGHSLGELTALHWANALTQDALLRLARVRGQVMAETPGPLGAMVSIALDARGVDQLLSAAPQVVIAGINSPVQTVISGPLEAVNLVIEVAQARGIAATRLPVSHAFHSPAMRPAVLALAAALAVEDVQPVQHRVISTVYGRALQADDDLRLLLQRQLTEPVHFAKALSEALQGVDLCLEVGPGRILSGLTQANSQTPVVAIDSAGASLQGLLQAVGAAFALGAPINRQALFADRFTRPFDPQRPLRFFVNPCELAPRSAAVAAVQPAVESVVAEEVLPAPATTDVADALDLVRRLVAQRAELPLAAVQADSRLLVDLHLNSISVGQLTAAAAHLLGLPPPLSPTDYASATVGQLAEALRDLAASGITIGGIAEGTPAGVDTWVRPFVVNLIETPVPVPRTPSSTGAWRVLAGPGHPWAEPLHDALTAWGGAGVAVCLDPQADEKSLDLLLEGARVTLALEGTPRYFLLIHHGSPGAAFARTLHLEARELTTCVVEVPPCPEALAWVLAEVRGAHGYVEAHYGQDGRRRVPQLELLSLPPEAADNMPLGASDVLLVSGGGKGIGAVCAAALAKESGARLALLGRSRPEHDAELADNLRRLTAEGVTHCYLVADVTDAHALRAAVAAVEQTLGPVTAILHSAGINRPTLLRDLDKQALQATLAPKVHGLRNLLAAVDDSRLRLLVSFGSIIGRSGMRGEADYALANESLTRLTEDFQATHPACRCVAVEWSVWAGIGMGERLGRVDALAHTGVMPIAAQTGIALLRRLLGQPPPATAIVAAGRLGELPTLRRHCPDLPFWRFLERPRVYYPGVELVVDADLSSTSDPYLADHVFQGEPLFPAVMGLEAMAQAAMALTGHTQAPVFEEVALLRPIVVGVGQQQVTLRIAALARTPEHVDVALRSSATAFQVDHFRAVCRFGSAPAVSVAATDAPRLASTRIALDPLRDLYGRALFHTGRFRRVSAYRHLTATRCEAEITADAGAAWFSRYLPAALVLGDPGARDAALHAIQACIPHGVVLPLGVARWTPIHLDAPGPWRIVAQERWCEDDTFSYDLEVRAADGWVRERWEGLRLRSVAEIRYDTWPAALLAPYLERRLHALLPGAHVSVALTCDVDATRQVRSDRALQHALGTNVRIVRRDDGKPEVADADDTRQISASHAQDLTLAVAADAETIVGCDVEQVIERYTAVWHDLLGEQHYTLATQLAQEANEPFDTAATRVWSALECFKKAGMLFNTTLTLRVAHADGWVLLDAAGAAIATYVARVQAQERLCVVAVLAGTVRAESKHFEPSTRRHIG